MKGSENQDQVRIGESKKRAKHVFLNLCSGGLNSCFSMNRSEKKMNKEKKIL